MGRLIQDKIKQPLAEELLFGKLVHGGEVKVKMKTGEDAKVGNPLAFEIVSAPPKGAKGKAKGKAEKAAE
jgi:ATP-dependent Clp protease ATP-binding subunit ClpA